MRRSPSCSVAALLSAVLLALIMARTSVVVVAQDQDVTADEDTFVCTSICPDENQVVVNPDTTVTYDWNKRVPVPSSTIAETVQTFTCAEFDVRLTTFDETDCAKHQAGLQEAGCACGSGSGALSTVVSFTIVAVAACATMMF